jgi:alpha,alpha-trehalase
MRTFFLFKWLCFLFLVLSGSITKAQTRFEKDLGELFEAVQMKGIFKDSKTFPDCTPLFPPADILKKYNEQKASPDFKLEKFVLANFREPESPSAKYLNTAETPVEIHVGKLWKVLAREPEKSESSLILLPKPYIVPGGRFREIYYWDSYFTMLGLQVSGEKEMIRNMVDNFAYLIDKVGFIPNGNRTYFLSRSQPPFFPLMVKLLEEADPNSPASKYLPQLEKEYNFWMNGADQLTAEKTAFRRVVRMADGEIMNRFFDDEAAPRPESYREDVELLHQSGRTAADLYPNIRAACESGWDFTHRWFKDGKTMKTIHTLDIIPVDLNSLMYFMEKTIAEAYQKQGNTERSAYFLAQAEKRKKAILKYHWDTKAGFFADYDWAARLPKTSLSAAGMFPLYFQLADANQAKAVAQKAKKDFIKKGGFATTLLQTGQQWDAPNGWAPLQWIAYQGLRNYQYEDLAKKVRNNWLENNYRVYKNTAKMVEKYNVQDLHLKAGGGEYPLQDGFGWSNGVFLRFWNEKKK